MNAQKWSGCFVAGLVMALVVMNAPAAQEKNSKGAADQKKAVAAKGDAAKGAKLFEDKCQICHEAKSDDVKVGPGLKGIFKKPPHDVNGKQHTHTTDSVREQILKGSPMMPPMEKVLTEQEINDLLAYLQTL